MKKQNLGKCGRRSESGRIGWVNKIKVKYIECQQNILK